MTTPIAVLTKSVRLPDDATELGIDVSRAMSSPLVLIDGRHGRTRVPSLRHRVDHLALKRAARRDELADLEASVRNDGGLFTVLYSDALFEDELGLPGLAFVSDPRGREWPRRDPIERLRGIAQTVVLVRTPASRNSAVIVRPSGAPPGPAPSFIGVLGLETVTVRAGGPGTPPDPLRKSMNAREVERFVLSIRPSFVMVEGSGLVSTRVVSRLLGQRKLNVGWIPQPAAQDGELVESSDRALSI